MVRVRCVKPLAGLNVELGFTDGSSRVVDLAPLLRGPVFDSIKRDPVLFRAVRVDDELGTIVWPNGADLDPDVLFHGRCPAEPEHDARLDPGASPRR